MDATANHRDEDFLDELGIGDALDARQHLQGPVHIGVKLRPYVLALEAHRSGTLLPGQVVPQMVVELLDPIHGRVSDIPRGKSLEPVVLHLAVRGGSDAAKTDPLFLDGAEQVVGSVK
jgi:hypothetical protein